jgi:hypothetical protein
MADTERKLQIHLEIEMARTHASWRINHAKEGNWAEEVPKADESLRARAGQRVKLFTSNRFNADQALIFLSFVFMLSAGSWSYFNFFTRTHTYAEHRLDAMNA